MNNVRLVKKAKINRAYVCAFKNIFRFKKSAYNDMYKLSFFRQFLIYADITVATCNRTDWFKFKFIVVLQQKTCETENKSRVSLQVYSHLQQITMLFLKTTEIILVEYKVTTLYIMKIIHYQKITSILELKCFIFTVFFYIMICIFKHNYKAVLS